MIGQIMIVALVLSTTLLFAMQLGMIKKSRRNKSRLLIAFAITSLWSVEKELGYLDSLTHSLASFLESQAYGVHGLVGDNRTVVSPLSPPIISPTNATLTAPSHLTAVAR